MRKYTVLYDTRCADKLKKTLSWKDVAKKPRDKKPVCFTIKNINSKYNQINWLPYKRIFLLHSIRYLFRPPSARNWKTTKSRLTTAKASLLTAILEKVWLSLIAPAYLANVAFKFDVWTSLAVAFAFASHVWTRFKAVHTSCPTTVQYSLDSNVNTPFFIIPTIIGVRHQSPSAKSRPCTPALNRWNPKIKIWILTCCPQFYFLHYKSSGKRLIKYQAYSSCVIMSVILMTTLFYKALMIYYKEKFDADHT